MSGEVHTTTDHDVIRQWAEQRGGRPAEVAATGDKDDPGILRIDFPDYGNDRSLREVSWDDFFDKFEDKGLALYLPGDPQGWGAQPIFQVRVP